MESIPDNLSILRHDLAGDEPEAAAQVRRRLDSSPGRKGVIHLIFLNQPPEIKNLPRKVARSYGRLASKPLPAITAMVPEHGFSPDNPLVVNTTHKPGENFTFALYAVLIGLSQ